MQDFRRLLVWQRSHALAVRVHRLTASFPCGERSALSSQMRRAATSVPFNIAEGFGRKAAARSNVDLLRFLSIASGSLHELDSQLEYARDVAYLAPEVAREQLSETDQIGKMLARLMTHLRHRDRFGSSR